MAIIVVYPELRNYLRPNTIKMQLLTGIIQRLCAFNGIKFRAFEDIDETAISISAN